MKPKPKNHRHNAPMEDNNNTFKVEKNNSTGILNFFMNPN